MKEKDASREVRVHVNERTEHWRKKGMNERSKAGRKEGRKERRREGGKQKNQAWEER